jgi:hypothetical protein
VEQTRRGRSATLSKGQRTDGTVGQGWLLLSFRRRARLAELRAELERLAHGRGGEAEVRMLDVARLALERLVAVVAVEEHVTGDDTQSHAGGEYIEQRSRRSRRYRATRCRARGRRMARSMPAIASMSRR